MRSYSPGSCVTAVFQLAAAAMPEDLLAEISSDRLAQAKAAAARSHEHEEQRSMATQRRGGCMTYEDRFKAGPNPRHKPGTSGSPPHLELGPTRAALPAALEQHTTFSAVGIRGFPAEAGDPVWRRCCGRGSGRRW
jgi:hypothetical protein